MRIRLPQGDRADAQRRTSLQYDTAFPHLPPGRSELNAADSGGCSNRYGRGAAIHPSDADVGTLRVRQYLERAPRALEGGPQILALAGALYAPAGNVIDVPGSADHDCVLARRYPQDAGCVPDLNSIDADGCGNSAGVHVQLSGQFIQPQAHTVAGITLHIDVGLSGNIAGARGPGGGRPGQE